jgi:3-oxoacyl-[acyl-carrier-protein] synthase-3
MSVYNAPCNIVGIGSCLGSLKITNEALAANLKTTPGFIEARTGIKARYRCDPEKENLYVLMAAAMEKAVHAADDISFEYIDGIFAACNPTGKFLLPDTPTVVASLVGIDNFYSGHGGTGCCGGFFALQYACNQLSLDTEENKTSVYAVVIGDETSAMITPGSLDEMLFSDGAVCVLVTNNTDLEPYYMVKKIDRKTTYEGSKALMLHRGADTYLHHDGRQVYKFAINIYPTILELTGKSRINPSTYFIPHQANVRIIHKLKEKSGLPNVYEDGVRNYGNTSPASVFMGLEDLTRRNLITTGQEILLAGFGEGLSVAVAELTSGRLVETRGKPFEEVLFGSPEIAERYMKEFNRIWEHQRSLQELQN